MTEPERRRGERRRGERLAAGVLLAGGPVTALAVLAVCVLAAVLVPLGLWRPALVVPALVVAAVAGWRPVRRLPVPALRVPVWTAAACVLVAVGFAVWAGTTHGEHVVLRRDAGSYALYAHWLATRHGLPVDAGLPAFGGPAALSVPGFSLDSPAFYQVVTGGGTGARIDPQFLLGAPALYALGWWLDGWTGLLTAPAVLGGLAVLAAAGLTARLAGPRWAPLGAAALALTQPVLHAARATYSEPAATLLVLGAAALAVDALGERADRAAARRLGVAAGALLGLAGLVRIDAVRDVALLVPVCALLWIRRHPAAVPMAGAAVVGIAVSMIPAVWLARPYLHTVWGSLRPLLLGTAALVVLSVVGVAAHRWWERRASTRGRAAPRSVLPAVAGGFVLLVGAGLASRPLWTTSRQAPDDPGNALVASLQRQQHLPVDGARTYAEQSVRWVVWFAGLPATLAALGALAVAAAVATGWWLRSRPGAVEVPGPPVPPALLPALVGLGSTVLTLYRPGITPDHPWADRRLVPVVLPVVLVGATVAAAASTRWLRRRWAAGALPPALHRALSVLVVLVAAGALLGPPYLGTRALATVRTELGEPAAVDTVCSRLRPGDVVVGVGDATGGVRAQNEWVQVVRGVCGHPSGALRGADVRPSIERLAALVAGAGGRLVLLSAGEDDGSARQALAALGQEPERAVVLHTTEDQHLLTRRPFARDGLVVDVWLAVWR